MATTFPFGRNIGVLNGASEVTLVPSPGSGIQRVVKSLYIGNKDTAIVTLTLYFANGASRYSILPACQLDPSDTLEGGDGDSLVLSTTSDSIIAKLSGAVATTEPDFIVSWADRTP